MGRKNYFKVFVDTCLGDPPDWLVTGGKTYLILMVQDVITEKGKKLKVTQDDMVEYALENWVGMNMSGCRTLSGWIGDWRPVDDLAHFCHDYFKLVDSPGYKRRAKKRGLIPKW